MAIDADLLGRVQRWIAADPDEETRREAQSLLDDADEVALRDRFDHRLQFGTAGLRGALGAGPNRMNRVIVRCAAAGLAQYLLETIPDAAARGVVIGFDARHGSATFASDSARVFAAAGLRAVLLPGPIPTPVCAWAIGRFGVAAAVMVTASHNPPQDNGYKVYLGDGAQIVPPHDFLISAQIDAVGLEVKISGEDHPAIERPDRSVLDGYLDLVATVRLQPDIAGVTVASTALHGVGGEFLKRAFVRAGFAEPIFVTAQQQPDPDFPTVAFPNPEEPGAMDGVIALATESGAAVALANDPDADRLGVAIPLRAGGWRRLTGDEIGWLLADHILRFTSGPDRLVVTTLVSSSLLARMAAAHDVHHLETFTGFKWIGRAVLDHPEWRFVFGYEQALGYLVAPRPLDKDGITAAVMMAEVAALAVHEGTTLEGRLAHVRETYGNLVIGERSIRLDPQAAATAVHRLSTAPPTSVAGRTVDRIEQFPEAGLVRLWCGALRLQVRPSGTEPKVKLYAEAEDEDPAPALEALADWLLGAG